MRRWPGLGEVRALTIARERWLRGGRIELGDIESLPGIGPGTARAVAEHLRAQTEARPP
jgi:hypothetical protein